MNDKERLDRLENGSTFDSQDINWLLKQVRINIIAQESNEILGESLKQSIKQNEKYREAIDKIMVVVNEHLFDETKINPYEIDDVVDELEGDFDE